MTGHKYTSSLSFFLWGNKKKNTALCLLRARRTAPSPDLIRSLGPSVPGVIAGMREMPGLPKAAPNWKREGNAAAVFISGVYSYAPKWHSAQPAQ